MLARGINIPALLVSVLAAQGISGILISFEGALPPTSSLRMMEVLMNWSSFSHKLSGTGIYFYRRRFEWETGFAERENFYG